MTSCNDDSPVSAVQAKILFKSISSSNDFKIKDQRPELTIQVPEDYFINNFSGQDGFVLANGTYSKKIQEDKLDVQFSDDADGM